MENIQDLLLINTIINDFNYKKFKKYNINDQSSYKRFTDQDDNARLFINYFNDTILFYKIHRNKNIGNFVALSIDEYYDIDMKGNGPQFLNLSYSDRADYDARNGDIIIINKDTNKEYHIDLKTSDGYLGCISLGSLVKFNEDGYYLLVNIKSGNSKFIPHKTIVDAIKYKKISLNAPSKRKIYQGYPVTTPWDGQKLTSEYYIKGSDIAKL